MPLNSGHILPIIMSQNKGKIPSDTPPQQKDQDIQEEKKSSGTYEAGCHCGYIKFGVTLIPALPQTKVLNCNCSACTRFGYLLVCEFDFPPFFSFSPCPVSEWVVDGEIQDQKQRRLKHRSSLPDPEASSVTWHNDSRARCSNYRFNTKEKDQMYCKHCGASIGIDFREVYAPKHVYGISVGT